MQAENNNDIAITEAKLKDFLSSVLSSEGIVVDIRRTFIEYNGVNRSRVFARHANRMACKGSNEKFVVIALLCYPALQWLLKAQDIDALIEKLKEENEDESVWRMSNIQRILESSMGGCKPQLRLEMRKLFFARCQQLVDEIDEAMNKAVFMNPASKPSRISLAMAMLRGSILDSDPVTAVTIRNNFDSIVEDVTAIAGDAIKPLTFPDEYPATTDLEGNEIALAGQDVVFRITLKEVDEIKLTDQNVKDNIATQDGFVLSDGSAVDTVEKLKQYYTETYERDSLKTAVYSYIIDNTTVGEIPQSILDDQRESYRQEIKAIAASYNISEEEYLQQVGAESEDALLDTYNDQIKNSVTSLLIFQAIAEEQHIKVTDADVNAYFGNDELSVKQAKSYYGEEFLNQSVLFDKVYTWLVDHASIV